MWSVHQVIRSGGYTLLTEVGDAERSVPGLAAIVRIVEPGWSHMNVFHPHCHGKTWLTEIDPARAIGRLLPSGFRGHAGDLSSLGRLESIRVLDTPGFATVQTARHQVLSRPIPVD